MLQNVLLFFNTITSFDHTQKDKLNHYILLRAQMVAFFFELIDQHYILVLHLMTLFIVCSIVI